ncbi:MAG: homocysteine S-methyltransferase family protein [Treponemataceae bacterium]
MLFKEFLHNQIGLGLPIFFDGSMETMIHAYEADHPNNILHYERLEDLNFSHPDIIEHIHRRYMQAGCHVITTNTFEGNPIKLRDCKFCAVDLITQAHQIIKKMLQGASDIPPENRPFIALDMGPSGKRMKPAGDLSFEQAYEAFKTCAITAEKVGIDLVIIKNITDLDELKAAICAIKENTALPIIVSLPFQYAGKTFAENDVQTMVSYLEKLAVDALGFNCGNSLSEAETLTNQLVSITSLPVIVQLNTDIPLAKQEKTVFALSPEEFAQAQYNHFLSGASIVGGCYGTTSFHLAELTQFFRTHLNEEIISARLSALKEKKAIKK